MNELLSKCVPYSKTTRSNIYFLCDCYFLHELRFVFLILFLLCTHLLAVYQEFHPNMVLNRCRFNRVTMSECYGEESLRTYGNRIIISSGALLGTKDAVLVWAHHMTLQLQDAPGRQVETRCTSGGIDHSFINWLVYGFKLRQFR